MIDTRSLPDLLQWSRTPEGDEVLYRFCNGMQIRTEAFHKADSLRILPLGSPQGAMMNHLLNNPGMTRDKRVFEPFAGSGALGLMALRAGASHVDFLDINARAESFHLRNAELNGFEESLYESITGDIEDFIPTAPYDVILANPPFVPTPDGIQGTLTSNGGPEGSRFVNVLLDRLEELLMPGGRALIYAFQFVRQGEPLITERISQSLPQRPVEITPTQEHPIHLAAFCDAYAKLFPDATASIADWQVDLVSRYGEDLTASHYILDVLPQSESQSGWQIQENFAEKFGASYFVPSANESELALGRAFENYIMPPTADQARSSSSR